MPTLKLVDGKLACADTAAEEEISFEAWRAGARPETDASALLLPNDVPVDEVGRGVKAFGAVVLSFPGFRDGRAYTQARLLRERYGFRGEIRARGDVLRDQIAFMARCGVDAFEIDAGEAENLNAAFDEFSLVYQTAADCAAPVWRRRAERAIAAE
ncbi:MAG: DUF934 domain-containing protein [Parvularculaceae bacterium]